MDDFLSSDNLLGDLSRGSRSVRPDDRGEEIFNEELREFGVTFGDVENVAKQFGITLFEDGRLVEGSLQLLRDEMLEAAQAALQFQSTFEDQLREGNLRSRLSGVDQDPLEVFRQQVNAAGQAGGKVITDAFGRVSKDLSADELRAQAQKLLEAFDAGNLDALDVGKLSRDDLLGIIEGAADAADALDQLAEATRKSLADQQELLQLRSRIAGEDQDPADIFRRQIEGLGELTPNLAARFDGLLSAGDVEAMRAALLAQLDLFKAGVIPEGLEGDELLRFIQQGADYLDSFNDATKDATKRLGDLNIPQGFRRAALAFQTGDRGPDQVPKVEVTLPPGRELGDVSPDPIRVLGGDGAALPLLDDILGVLERQNLVPLTGVLERQGLVLPRLADTIQTQTSLLPRLTDVLSDEAAVLRDLVTVLAGEAPGGAGSLGAASNAATAAVTVQVAAGAIVVHAAPGQSPEAIAASVLQQFRQLAMNQWGDTLQGVLS